MPALRVQMQLHLNAGLNQRIVVSQRVLHMVQRILLRRQQEPGWPLAGDVNIGMQRRFILKQSFQV